MSRLINITEECWETVIRTAFSIIIGECQDFACELLDSNGNQLVILKAMQSLTFVYQMLLNQCLNVIHLIHWSQAMF